MQTNVETHETPPSSPRPGPARRIATNLSALVLSAGMFAFAQEQGGSAVVSFQNDVSTLDPQIGYDWQNWSIIKTIFDGLMDYVPGTTELRPHLAESYEVSEDGRTYTFALRQGVKFHNGREMVADDVRYTFERVLNPETQSPGQGFYLTIEGAQEFIDGTADSISGLEVVDDYTIRFTTSEPDASFLHKLGLNFAHVVPQEADVLVRR